MPDDSKSRDSDVSAQPDAHPVARDCEHCDGSGEVWESCGCYQCEYSSGHSRYVDCANCDGRGWCP
jgi:hypothetical protein